MANESRSRSSKREEFWERMGESLDSEGRKALFEALETFSADPPRAFRRNLIKPAAESLLADNGLVALKPVPWESSASFVNLRALSDLGTNPVVGAGLVYIQEPGAMEAVNMLGPEPGDLVLDLCAAPGAKSSQIGERLGGKGWLVANDPVRSRAERLEALLSRHGVLNSSVYSLDPTSLSKNFANCFDRILVDAPCSGESLFAKRRDHRSDIRDSEVAGCARRQFTILSCAAQMLRPGGVLVYSTCSYSKAENENLVKSFLENHPNWELTAEQRRWPHLDGVPGGYTSRLVRKSDDTSGPRVLRWSDLHGNMRHGALRWNGEWDSYAEVMSPFPRESILSNDVGPEFENPGVAPVMPSVELNEAEARRFFHGEALACDAAIAKGLVRLSWQGFSIGVGRHVEGRINNLLPRLLRGPSVT